MARIYPPNQKVQLLFVRLGGFGVAHAADTVMGQLCTQPSTAEVGTNMWKNLVPGDARTYNLRMEGLMLYQLSHGCCIIIRNDCGMLPICGYAVYSQLKCCIVG